MKTWLVKWENFKGEVFTGEFCGSDWEHAKSTIPHLKEVYWKKSVSKEHLNLVQKILAI